MLILLLLLMIQYWPFLAAAAFTAVWMPVALLWPEFPDGVTLKTLFLVWAAAAAYCYFTEGLPGLEF